MNEITSERNRLVAMGIALLVLAILASTAHRLPEAYRLVAGYLSVGGIIRLVILFIMLGVVLSARPLLATVAVHYAHSGFKTRELPERREVATHVTGLATEIVNVIIIAVVWPIVARVVSTLLLMDVARDFDWISIIVTVVFVAVLLWQLYLCYQSLKPVLDATSGGKAKLPCPQCGTLNTPGAKFCISCGAELQAPQAEAKTGSLICTKCGTPNTQGARFCISCGAELQAPRAEAKPGSLICPKCGAENKAGSKFCHACGAALSEK
jgi:predicted RNA-binding Zn-ribbon protein involved in translation (DUF1610 family)